MARVCNIERYGWKVLVKDLPVGLNEIRNKAYVDKVSDIIFVLYTLYMYCVFNLVCHSVWTHRYCIDEGQRLLWC